MTKHLLFTTSETCLEYSKLKPARTEFDKLRAGGQRAFLILTRANYFEIYDSLNPLAVYQVYDFVEVSRILGDAAF